MFRLFTAIMRCPRYAKLFTALLARIQEKTTTYYTSGVMGLQPKRHI
jgi:hypothetical protein